MSDLVFNGFEIALCNNPQMDRKSFIGYQRFINSNFHDLVKMNY